MQNPGCSSQSWPMHYGSSLLIGQQRKHINDTTWKDRNTQKDRTKTNKFDNDKTSMLLLQMHSKNC